MVAPGKEILEQALALRKEDRAELAGALIRSLGPAPEAGVDEAWRAEIERRAHEIETGAVQCIPAAEVFSRLDRILGK